MKLLRIIILSVILAGCGASKKSSHYLTGKNEVLIESIIVDFDELMKSNSQTDNLPEAYAKFSEKLKWNESADDFENKIDEIRAGCHEILESLANEKGFDEIWTMNYGFADSKMTDTVSTMYEFSLKGWYFDFLESRANRDSLFLYYYKGVRGSNSIPPSLAADFPHTIENFDLEDKEDRLIFAVHYITLLSHKEKSR